MMKLLTIAALMLLIIALSSFVLPHKNTKQTQIEYKDPYKAQNLKILPKDISESQLKQIMQSFNDALGVDCDFCHAMRKDGQGLDFPSDKNEHKIIARKMMKMEARINKKNFGKNPHHRLLKGTSCVDCHVKKGIYFQITCKTCHNGNKMPSTVELKDGGQQPDKK